MARLLIGELAERSGVSATTIRYYEQIGLLRAPARSPSGYRRYGEGTIEELQFIRKGQALGFSLDQMRDILTLSRSGSTPCTHVRALARERLAAVDEQIRRLRRFRAKLATEIHRWEGQDANCQGLCQIIASADLAEDLDLSDERRSTRRGMRVP